MMRSCDKLVIDNVGLVYAVAKRYFSVSDFSQDDIVSIGMVGLVLAAKDYNEDIASFSTKATVCIRNMIVQEIMRRGRFFKMFPRLHKLCIEYVSLLRDGKEIVNSDIELLAHKYNVEYGKALALYHTIGTGCADFFLDNTESQDDVAINNDSAEKLRHFFYRNLCYYDQYIVSRNFGIYGCKKKSLESIANELNKSKYWVSKRRCKVLHRIRKYFMRGAE